MSEDDTDDLELTDLRLVPETDAVLTFTPDGHIVISPKYDLDQAARAFWDYAEKLHPGILVRSKPS